MILFSIHIYILLFIILVNTKITIALPPKPLNATYSEHIIAVEMGYDDLLVTNDLSELFGDKDLLHDTTFKYIPPDIPLKKYIPLNITLTGIGIEKDQSCNFEMEKKTIQIISIDRCDDYTLDGVFILAVVYNMDGFLCD